ncbi:hypothetical protein HMI54_007912 [Coelomomyces lativittatus]|nr:hypothetical protein HMI54_007912 [Coelomomyces lativittatus]
MIQCIFIVTEASNYSNENTNDDFVIEIITGASASDTLQTLQVFITSLPDNSTTSAFAKKHDINSLISNFQQSFYNDYQVEKESKLKNAKITKIF